MEGLDPSAQSTLEIPIFPLPNVVFFPHTRLPLHIFEPRYRQMVHDALEGSRHIGVNLLRPGWEKNYYENPAIFVTGSVGRIAEKQLLEGGDLNILLEGFNRYRVLHFTNERPYRVARVELLKEVVPSPKVTNEVATELLLMFLELSGDQYSELTQERLERLDSVALINTICSALNLPANDKQKLLESEVGVRARNVFSVLKQQVSHQRFVSTFAYLRPEHPNHN